MKRSGKYLVMQYSGVYLRTGQIRQEGRKLRFVVVLVSGENGSWCFWGSRSPKDWAQRKGWGRKWKVIH